MIEQEKIPFSEMKYSEIISEEEDEKIRKAIGDNFSVGELREFYCSPLNTEKMNNPNNYFKASKKMEAIEKAFEVSPTLKAYFDANLEKIKETKEDFE